MNTPRSRMLHFLVSSVALFLLSAPAVANIWYVDDDAAGAATGLSWTDAFVQLQEALAVAADGDEIRVAQGTYRPDETAANPTGTGDRAASFDLIDGVAIYGGYAGVTEPDPDARDIDLFETILSGDLLEDDGPDFTNYTENSIHVVTADSICDTSVLDGLTVAAGYADAGDVDHPWHWSGAALFNRESSPTVVDCTFRDNVSQWVGGAVYNLSESNATYVGCVFVESQILSFGKLGSHGLRKELG